MSVWMNIILFCGVLVSASRITRTKKFSIGESLGESMGESMGNAPCSSKRFMYVVGGADGIVDKKEWHHFFQRIYKVMDEDEFESEIHAGLRAAVKKEQKRIEQKEFFDFIDRIFDEIDVEGKAVKDQITKEEFDEWGEINGKKNFKLKLHLKTLACGFCTEHEFFKAITDVEHPTKIAVVQWHDYFDNLFTKLDMKKDGLIDMAELRAEFLMKSIMEANQHRGTKEISKEEWFKYFEDKWNVLNKNHDAELSIDEWRHCHKLGVTKFAIRAYVCAVAHGD